jgi:branched-chain amino acid transport system substrate-binding protein
LDDASSPADEQDGTEGSRGEPTMNFSRSLLALVAVSALAVATAGAAGAASLTLPFGVATSLSGAAAPTGRGMLRAVELAAEDINAAGGIKAGSDTYTLKLIVYDNKYDTREGVSVANKLIFSDKVKHLITAGGTVIIAVDPIITENRVLNFAYAYGGKKATNPSAPYTIRTIPEPAQAFETLMPWVVKKYGVKTLAITSTDDETGLIQAEDSERVSRHLGVTITDKTFAPRGTPDFTPMMTKLLAKKPDAIDFGAWAGSDGPVICKQTRELGYKGLFILSYTQSVPTFLKVASDCADGALFFQLFGGPPTPLAERVAKRYEEKYKEKFDPLVWRNYDVLWVLKRAIEMSGTVDPTKLKDVVRTVRMDGVFGKTRIGGKSYYGIDSQFLYPIPVSTYSARDGKWVELYRGTVPESY